MLLKDFLTFLGGVGVVAAVSWVWEYFGWGAAMDAKKKQMIFFAVCVVVALAAYATTVYVPQTVLDQIAPFFAVVATIFTYLFLGNNFHQVTKDQNIPKNVTIVPAGEKPVVVPPVTVVPPEVKTP